METRFLVRAVQRIASSRPCSHVHHFSSSSKATSQQANPIGDYYASILESSSPAVSSKPPTTANKSSTPLIPSTPADTPPQAAILFSSRLSSPLERRNEIQKNSTLIAGVWVPQKPDEPDNCCMSGCVNCVWDRYGEELEEWATKRKEADAALMKDGGLEKAKKRRQKPVTTLTNGVDSLLSMDDDGGGSETNWTTGLEPGFTNDDLFKDVPVGIREFMKQEKKLKQKHALEGTNGG